MNTVKCPLSDYNVEEEKLDGITFWKVCDFKYGIEDKLVTEIKNKTADKKYLIYSLLHEYFILHDKVPILSTVVKEDKEYSYLVLEDLLSTTPNLENIPYRVLRMYVKISEKENLYFSHTFFIFRSLGFPPELNRDWGFFFSRDGDTALSIISYLNSLNYIDIEHNSKDSYRVILRPEGIAFVKGYIGDSNKGFVAMKFGKSPRWADKNGKIYEEGERDLDEFYDDFIAPAIMQAGFEPVRIDRTLHNNKIDDEILVQIRKSKFVVCDLTYGNLGAYYEGGFAQGLGKEVFFICEKEFFDSHPPHFDLNHHVTTLYERGKEEEFIRELAARIENNVIRI